MGKYPAVLQARNGSSRFPGKAMKPVLGKPMIHYLVERIEACPSVYKIVLATTVNTQDDALAEFCRRSGVTVFRGSENNVLDRTYQCVKDMKDEYFIKFWGDNPLIDPVVCEDMIVQFEARFPGYDYVSNNHPCTYPEGMQIEIIKRVALEKAYHAKNITDVDREHVTPPIWRNPHLFRVGNIEYETNIHDDYRICLDYPEDFEQIRRIIEALYPLNPLFTMEDMITYLDEHPEVKNININRYESEPAYYLRQFKEDTRRLPGNDR